MKTAHTIALLGAALLLALPATVEAGLFDRWRTSSGYSTCTDANGNGVCDSDEATVWSVPARTIDRSREVIRRVTPPYQRAASYGCTGSTMSYGSYGSSGIPAASYGSSGTYGLTAARTPAAGTDCTCGGDCNCPDCPCRASKPAVIATPPETPTVDKAQPLSNFGDKPLKLVKAKAMREPPALIARK